MIVAVVVVWCLLVWRLRFGVVINSVVQCGSCMHICQLSLWWFVIWLFGLLFVFGFVLLFDLVVGLVVICFWVICVNVFGGGGGLVSLRWWLFGFGFGCLGYFCFALDRFWFVYMVWWIVVYWSIGCSVSLTF